MAKKYDEAVKGYTPAQIKAAKKRAKAYYLEHNGEVSVKVLSRIAKVPQGYIREWMREKPWDEALKESPEDKVQLSNKTKGALASGAKGFGLTEQEELFCYHYMKTFNATTSAIRAGYSSSYGHNKAYRLLKTDKVKGFLNHIKGQRNEELFIDGMRIIQEYIKVAFADITDFIKFGPGGVSLRSSSNVDGQLITKVSEGKNGITIELADKMAALSKLERYLDVMPTEWKQIVEERKTDLLAQRLELEKQKVNGPEEEAIDDGFLEALKGSAKEVWKDEI